MYQIRTMTREELDIAISWAAEEGWNPGLYDADAFYATDPNGFFIGLLDNQPIACISAVSYNNSFGFMGFYIVRKEYLRHNKVIKMNKSVDNLGFYHAQIDEYLCYAFLVIV